MIDVDADVGAPQANAQAQTCVQVGEYWTDPVVASVDKSVGGKHDGGPSVVWQWQVAFTAKYSTCLFQTGGVCVCVCVCVCV
jgi:hypothetical protein